MKEGETGLIKKIPQNINKLLKNIYEKNSQNLGILFETAKISLKNDKDISNFIDLLKSKEFLNYLKISRNYGKRRFSLTTEKIMNELIKEKNIQCIKNICLIFSDPIYIKAFRKFFQPKKLDFDLYDLFETNVIELAKKDLNSAKLYCELLINFDFLRQLKQLYSSHSYSFFHFCSDFLLQTIKKENEVKILENFISIVLLENFQSLIQKIESKKYPLKEVYQKILTSVLTISYSKAVSGEKFIKLLNFVLDYDEGLDFIYSFINIFNKIIFNDENLELFFNVLKKFPIKKSSIDSFIWKFLLGINEEKFFIECLKFLDSDEFSSFYYFFINNKEIDLFEYLLRHLFIALSKAIENFEPGFYPIVIKEIINTRLIDKIYFFKKRFYFFSYFESKNRSSLLKNLILRAIFYEYVLLNQGKYYTKKYKIKLTEFFTDFQKIFSTFLDNKVDLFSKEKKENKYDELIKIMRSFLWLPVMNRFSEFKFHIKELISISLGLDLDDFIIPEILKVPKENFLEYYAAIKRKVRENPDNTKLILEAIKSDFWCRVYFDQVFQYIYEVLLPVVGAISIVSNFENLAYTNGKSIFLPSYISDFYDDPSDLKNNRNVTIFVGLSLHEAGHLFGGTFKFNYTKIINSVKYPKLLKNIFNLIEDFRVEAYIKKIKIHSQASEILNSINIFYIRKILEEKKSILTTLFYYIMSNVEKIYNYIISYNKQIEDNFKSVLKLEILPGFKNLEEFANYAIDVINKMKINNPLAGFKVALKLYNILENMEISEADEFVSSEANFKGENYGEKMEEKDKNHEKSNEKLSQKEVLSKEELEELYDLFDRFPDKFKEIYGIPKELDNKNKFRNPFIEKVLDHNFNENSNFERLEPDYDRIGTFDKARKTKVEELLAKKQIEKFKEKDKKKNETKKQEEIPKKKDKVLKGNKRILTLNMETNTLSSITLCTEYEVKTIDYNFIKESQQRYGYIIKKIYELLKDKIEFLRSTTYENSYIEGDIDIERLIELLVDKKNRNNYEFLEYPLENKYSFNIIIGLDISGSTISYANKEMRIVDVEKHFAYIFSKVMKMLTDKVEVYAFNSLTSTTVFHANPIEALSSFKPDFNNRDGDFIRYITLKLKESNEEIKYFLLISDGKPNSYNYEGKYALDDTLLAIRECRKNEIKFIYFNIDSHLEKYFFDFQREATYAEHFSNPIDLIKIIPNLVERLVDDII